MHTIYQGRPGWKLGRRLDWTVSGLIDVLVQWHNRARQRAVLRTLSDHQLHDIGVSRADACREAAKPFWRA